MRLVSITIYGFGKLKDTTLTFHDGINIIEGLNEAGKSTMMAFIRGMLFGFENRRNPHLRYEPILGDRFGGVMVLMDEENKLYRIERIFNQRIAGDVKVFLPDGTTVGEEYLPSLLGKVNERVFKQIFSFGLSELQQIDSLKDNQINDFIYHAGTGFVQQILKLKQFLEQKQQELYKPSGQKPAINTILSKLEDTHQSLEQLKMNLGRHQGIVNRIEVLEKEIEELEQEQNTRKDELKWLEKLEQYYHSYQRIGEIDQELKLYIEPVIFPNKGIDRLEGYSTKVNELELELQQLQEKKKHMTAEIAAIQIDTFYISQEAKILGLKEGLTSYHQQGNAIQGFQKDLEHLQIRMKDNLHQLGSQLSIDKIRAIEITLQDKQMLQELGAEMEQKQGLLREHKKDLDLKKHQLSQLKQELRTLEEEKNNPKQQNDLEENYHRITKTYQRLKEKKWKHEQLLKQKETYLAELQVQGVQTKRDTNYLLAALSLAIAIGLFVFDQGVYTPVFLGLSVFLFFYKRISGNNSNRNFHENLRKTMKGIELEIKEIIEEIDSHQGELSRDLARLNLDFHEPSWGHHLEKQYKEWVEQKQKSQYRITQMEGYQYSLRKLEQEITDLMEDPIATLTEELTIQKNHWSSWLLNHHLPQDISPVILFDTISMIKGTKDWIYQSEALVSKIELSKKQREEFEDRVNRFILEVQLTLHGSFDEKIYHLVDKLKGYKENQLKLSYLEDRLGELKEKESHIFNKLKQEQQHVNELFQYAGVSNQEDFYYRAGQFERYEALMEEKNQMMISIRHHLGSEQEFNRLVHELSIQDLGTILNKLSLLRERQKQQQDLIKTASEEKGRLQNQLKQMESDYQLTELNQEYATLQAELKFHVKDWLSANITKQLLDKTMKIYETEKQPMVIKRASAYFNSLTGENYTKIISPLGTDQIEVIRRDEQRFTPQFLSRGTVEQLFLAMRFALVDEFSKQLALPVILDDIFVNFDYKRLNHALAVLQELGKRHQIILFTCHEHVTSTMKRNSDEVHILRL